MPGSLGLDVHNGEKLLPPDSRERDEEEARNKLYTLRTHSQLSSFSNRTSPPSITTTGDSIVLLGLRQRQDNSWQGCHFRVWVAQESVGDFKVTLGLREKRFVVIKEANDEAIVFVNEITLLSGSCTGEGGVRILIFL